MQHDLLTFIDISKYFNSRSHACSRMCKSHNDEDTRRMSKIDSIVNRTFLVNNIDRLVSNELEVVSDYVNVLRELIYCRGGTFNLSNSLFSHCDIEQLIIPVCTCQILHTASLDQFVCIARDMY